MRERCSWKEGFCRGEGGVQSPGGGVLVSEKLEVKWDLVWPLRISPKASSRKTSMEGTCLGPMLKP